MEPLKPLHERLDQLLEQGEAGEAEDLARMLARRIEAIVDRTMRSAVLETTISELDDAGLLGMLHRIRVGAAHGRQSYRELLGELAGADNLLLKLPYDRLQDLYAAATRAKLDDVARMFLGDRIRTNPSIEEARSDNEFLPISSGQRKSAARTGKRLILDRIIHDRDPAVIARFLANPRVVERDVVRVSAMNPTRPEILVLVARHPRWSSRYEIRKALVCNPCTPQPIALTLVSTLMQQDLRIVAESPAIAACIRDSARRLIRSPITPSPG